MPNRSNFERSTLNVQLRSITRWPGLRSFLPSSIRCWKFEVGRWMFNFRNHPRLSGFHSRSSSDVFLQNPGLRHEVRSKLLKLSRKSHASLIPKERPIASAYAVGFPILAEEAKKWPPVLPFFSAVNLLHTRAEFRIWVSKSHFNM